MVKRLLTPRMVLCWKYVGRLSTQPSNTNQDPLHVFLPSIWQYQRYQSRFTTSSPPFNLAIPAISTSYANYDFSACKSSGRLCKAVFKSTEKSCSHAGLPQTHIDSSKRKYELCGGCHSRCKPHQLPPYLLNMR